MKMKGKNHFYSKGIMLFIMNMIALSVFSQNLTVSGTVTDDTGTSVIGATVIVVGDASKGTVTDFDGNYTLTNVPSDASLQFSYVGMTTQVVPVNGRTRIDVVMAADTELLDEVVVTALGMKREQKALGYAMKEFKGDELITNVINPVTALQGKIAGVEISQSDGGMFGSSKILIRGASTLGKNNQPIYVVDGVILDNSIANAGDADWNDAANDYGNELKNLNPEDFATISVLKGAAATALYGSRGLNGAVVITTKSGQSRKGLGIQVSQTFGTDYVYKQPDLQNVYGDGAISSYVDYGATKPGGGYYTFDNQRQFMLNADGKPTHMGGWQGTGFGPKFDGSSIEYYDKSYKPYEAVKNNFKDTYNLGFNSNTNIAISGGNDKTTFYTSLGYLFNQGTLPNNDFKRITLLSKASHNITDRVNLEATLSFANSMPRNAQPNIGEKYTDGTWSRAYDPDFLKKKYKGAHGGLASTSYGDEYGSVPGRDIWWRIYENDYRRKETSVRPGLILRWALTDWLDWSTEGNYNYYYTRDESKELGSGYANEGGYYSMSQFTKEQTNFNTMLNAMQNFGEWTLGGFLRGEYYNNTEQNSRLWTNGGLIVPGQFFVNNSKENVGYDGYIGGQKRMYSIASQISASWNDQVFVDVTGRNDWSSSLLYSDGHGTYSYFYPSVSGSWLLHNTFDLPENVANYILLDGSVDYGNYRIGSVAKVGESYGILMSDSKKAIDEKTGLPLLNWSDTRRFAYYKRSGKAEIVGSLVPDFLSSVATGLRYKNWNLRASMDMRFGGTVASYGSRYGTAYGYTAATLKYSAPEYGGLTWTSKYDNMTYSDGLIPEGVLGGGTNIKQSDGTTYTVAEGGETYQSLYEKGKVEPVHASAWHYFTNSWGQGVINDNWVSELNYIALREVTLSYKVPQTFAQRMGATHLNLSLTGRNLGYLLNNMPNGENPESVRGNSVSEFRVRTFSPFTANYMFTVNIGF